MVGTAGGGVPPVTIVPAPVKVRAMDRPIVAEPDRDGNDPPVTATMAREPPVTAIEPPVKLVPEIAATGSLKVPANLSDPASVMVKGPLRLFDESGVRGTVELNVPLPM